MKYINVWDLPTRLFHWLLVAAVTGAFVSVKLGGNAMIWHERFGMAVIALIAFRLAWGLWGGTYARFLTFFPTPARLRNYLSGRWRGLGHSPIGALSVFAMLGLFGLQAVLGLFAYDDIAFGGPLVKLVSNDTTQLLTAWHHRLEWVLIAIVVLHLLALVVYRLRGRKLVGPMIHGRTQIPAEPVAPAHRARWWQLLAAVGVAALAVWAASGDWIAPPPPPPAVSAPAW